MQHAAATMDETMREAPNGAGKFCAFLRLRQGASARATWILEESSGGTMITVGSDESCDWQVRAAFVPARAFSLLVVGGRTFVRSGPEPGVLLNGKPIDDGWCQVSHGGRIDVGLARLEITMGYGDTSGKLVDKIEQVEESNRRTVSQIKDSAEAKRDVGRTTMNLAAIPIAPVDQLDQLEDLLATTRRPVIAREPKPEVSEQAAVPAGYEYLLTSPRKPESKVQTAMRNRTIELQLEDVYMEPELAAAVPEARTLGQESGEFDVGALPRDGYEQGAPSLLEVEEPTDKSYWWMYAVAGLATAGAYGGWLIILDRL